MDETLLGKATEATRLCVSFVAKKQQNVKPTDHDRAQHEKSASEIQKQENRTQGSIARYAKSATLQSTWRCSAGDRAPASTQKSCE
jgi:acyl-CoA hydrolase